MESTCVMSSVGTSSGFGALAQGIYSHKYAWTKEDGTKETWPETTRRVVDEVVRPYLPSYADGIYEMIVQRKFMPGGRYLYAAGRKFNQVNNCFLFDVEDSREGWAGLMYRVTNALMTGGGVGAVYTKLREEGAPVKGMGGLSTGPIALMNMVNEAGRHIMQGGSRRAAVWAGLHWNHLDVRKFVHLKDWPEFVKAKKAEDFNFPATMDGTNISVILDDAFFAAYHDKNNPAHKHAYDIYWDVVWQMCRSGEPGFSVDVGVNAGEHLRNACTEITSSTDNDVCNLGSINMAQIENVDEMRKAVELSTAFLICGTLYSKVPFPEVADVREKNRRLGLGLMGIHEWLLVRGKRYGADEELGTWMGEYVKSTEYADKICKHLNITPCKKTRAIAPTGTISILAETTSGIEPIFCVAYLRRYLKGRQWHAQYAIDNTARKLIERGISVDQIEDAYELAKDVERRISFQAWMQKYVDHAISSTVNLPEWGSEYNNGDTVHKFGEMLIKYLPGLRGMTSYPDGSRGGQPLTPVSYKVAIKKEGVEFVENTNCTSGSCGV